jgi:hypothetical protein
MKVNVTTVILGLPDGKRTRHTSLALPAATLSVRELIARKAQQEVAKYGAQGTADDGLAATARPLAAVDFMVVIDDQRIIDPDTVVTLHPDSRIEFIKILPLVGG